MGNRVSIRIKMVFLVWIVFAPYYLWLFRNLILDKMPPYPWPAVIGLTYIPLAVCFLVFVHKRMYRRELAAIQTSCKYPGVAASAHLPEVVWISSIDHLKRFQELPWYAKWFGLLPKGFPKVRAGLISYPLLYFAQGMLSLNGDSFKFSARFPIPEGTKSYANLATDLRLSLAPNQVLSVSRFDMRQIASTATPLPFIRVQTTSGELQDFLVCAGATDVSLIARQTESLWFALGAFLGKAKDKDSGSRLAVS